MAPVPGEVLTKGKKGEPTPTYAAPTPTNRYNWTMVDRFKQMLDKNYWPPGAGPDPRRPQPPPQGFQPPGPQSQVDPAAEAVRQAIEQAGNPDLDPNRLTQEDLVLINQFNRYSRGEGEEPNP
jgi:hypothetical protein